MARYRGPRVKIVRRLGELPGLTSKIPNRNYPAGQHGPSIWDGKNVTIPCTFTRKTKITLQLWSK